MTGAFQYDAFQADAFQSEPLVVVLEYATLYASSSDSLTLMRTGAEAATLYGDDSEALTLRRQD